MKAGYLSIRMLAWPGGGRKSYIHTFYAVPVLRD